jgi:dethiobiotin synthetase
MRKRIVIVGTDTNVGKTVFSAALAGALGFSYWKPVQSGLEDETDSAAVARLGGLAPGQILPEAYRLRLPASPHIAARAEGCVIDRDRLAPSDDVESLVIETAGGVMVPLTDELLTVDLLAEWGFPIVLVARTALGTINHSLLTIEALRRRNIPILGVVFSGDAEPAPQDTIGAIGRVKILGRLPRLDPLGPETLRVAFAAAFRTGDFV